MKIRQVSALLRKIEEQTAVNEARMEMALSNTDTDKFVIEEEAERMRAAGCRVQLEIWPRMPHVWHLFAPVMPEAHRAIARIGEFVAEAMRPSPDRRR